MPVFPQDPKFKSSLPPATDSDNGKVLTANEDGTAEWKEPKGGGINITQAYVGQTIVVKAVDENGKPTEWEAVNLPKSTNIITVDSFEELPQASTVPMRTIALVTSEG